MSGIIQNRPLFHAVENGDDIFTRASYVLDIIGVL